MSAFVVEDKTINSILAWLHNDAMSSNGASWGTSKRQLAEAGYNTDPMYLTPDSDLHRLGQDMFDLNADAVNQRYGPGEAGKFRPLDYKFKPQIPPTTIQCLKSLECWLYQCSEGNVPDQPLYKTFEGVERTLLRAIVDRLPEYEQAEWS